MRARFGLTALAVCLLTACGDDSSDVFETDTTDDTTEDVGVETDATEDTGGDGGSDVTEDAGETDTGEDAAVDTGDDATVDAGDAGEDATTDTGGDTGPDAGDDPCDGVGPGLDRALTLPAGDTLFFDGDDYLSFWGTAAPCEVVITSRPDGATAEIVDGQRLTPDAAGTWVLTSGDDQVTVTVDDDWLEADTFLNYNYSPSRPLAVVDGTIWAVHPPANRVYAIDPAEASPTPVTFDVASWPVSIVPWDAGELLLVAQAGRDTLGFFDPEQGIVDAIRVGNEPADIVVEGDVAWVSLSGADAVVRVDLAERTVTDRIDVGREPRSLAFDTEARRLYVASLLSSNAHPMGLQQVEPVPTEAMRDIAVIDVDAIERVAYVHDAGTILRGLWQDPATGELWLAHTDANNLVATVDADARPHIHRMSRLDVDPDSDTAYQTAEVLELDDRDGSAGPAASPHTMARTPDGETVLVTLSASASLLVLDGETMSELGRIPVGNDPRGLVFAEGRAWTLAWLDGTVEGVAWPVDGENDVRTVALPGDPTPEDVHEGRRMFNDAGFSRHGDFSCNNCHVDGLTDGMTWNLLVDGDVNTLAFRNVGGTDPFLWGGQLPTLFDFSREVLKLVGANASGDDMELLTLYMQSVTAPPNPHTAPGGRLTEAGERGRIVFETVGCVSCHSGSKWTNQSMVDGKTDGIPTDVPSLIGVYDTAPYGRTGRWTTLEEMVDYAVHDYMSMDVTDAELSDLVAYVEQIPGDVLYMQTATPLNNNQHVWVETPIELGFSTVLLEGQTDVFSIVAIDEEGVETAVDGTWSQSGRYVRFVPDDVLAGAMDYRIDAEPGIEGVFGERTREPIRVEFHTGGAPETDVSGPWSLRFTVEGVGSAAGRVAFLQSRGGQVTGVSLDDFDEGSIGHVEGVVSGMTLALDPFYIDSVFGELYVAEGIIVETVDEDGDGYADSGTGYSFLEFAGTPFDIDIVATRLALPDEPIP